MSLRDARSEPGMTGRPGTPGMTPPSIWRKSFTLSGSHTAGIRALSDCLVADRAMRCARSVLYTRRSERSPMSGTRSSTPSSVAFSTNHSKRSLFLVGQQPSVRWYGCAPKPGTVESTWVCAPLGVSSTSVQWYSVPRPSMTSMGSPARCRSTRTQCPLSSASK